MSLPVWAPSADQVAAILRARTRGTGSRDAASAMEQGRWTETTRPTIEQVQGLIETACGDVQLALRGRTLCTTDLASSATTAAMYRTCMLIETSYGSSARGADSVYGGLRDMWDETSKALRESTAVQCPLVSESAGGDGGALAPGGKVPGRVLIGPSQGCW